MDQSSTWKLLLAAGLIVTSVAFILGWIGFGVPDWHAFRPYDDSLEEYYGLWAYCQDQAPLYESVCERWSEAEVELFDGTRPSFINTSEGLITTGMILLSIGLVIAIVATILPFLAYIAAVFSLFSFIFLIIGIPIFARQSNKLSQDREDAEYTKRYGFWLMVVTIVLQFIATLLYLAAGILYKMHGHGNIASGSANQFYGGFDSRPYGGQQMLGTSNLFPGNTSYGIISPALSRGRGMGFAPYPYSVSRNQQDPSLLSQYLAQQVTPIYGPNPSTIGASVLLQPSVRSIETIHLNNVKPAYCRSSSPLELHCKPIVNQTGETVIGPLRRVV